jgi:hypothetical protein
VPHVAAPYTWLSNPAHFGFSANPAWRPAAPGDEWALAAAQQQHALAHAVREWKQVNRKSDKHLAAALGVHPETVGRYLRGELGVDLQTFNRLAYEAGLRPNLILRQTEDPSSATTTSHAQPGEGDA